MTPDPMHTADALLAAPPVKQPLMFCTCGHAHGEHRHDLKRLSCGRGTCPCAEWQHGRTIYRVSRWEAT